MKDGTGESKSARARAKARAKSHEEEVGGALVGPSAERGLARTLSLWRCCEQMAMIGCRASTGNRWPTGPQIESPESRRNNTLLKEGVHSSHARRAE